MCTGSGSPRVSIPESDEEGEEKCHVLSIERKWFRRFNNQRAKSRAYKLFLSQPSEKDTDHERPLTDG